MPLSYPVLTPFPVTSEPVYMWNLSHRFFEDSASFVVFGNSFLSLFEMCHRNRNNSKHKINDLNEVKYLINCLCIVLNRVYVKKINR